MVRLFGLENFPYRLRNIISIIKFVCGEKNDNLLKWNCCISGVKFK